MRTRSMSLFFFFNDTATTEIYTLSLHDALPISAHRGRRHRGGAGHDSAARPASPGAALLGHFATSPVKRSEEHTSELQSQSNLVCRLLLEKKKDCKAVTYQFRDRAIPVSTRFLR